MSMTPEAEDFFRSRLDQMIDLRHPLAKLASRMPWQEIEASIAQLFARKARAGKRIDDVDLFGSTSTLVGGGISNAGRPRMPLRLMVSLLYLKHAYNESGNPRTLPQRQCAWPLFGRWHRHAQTFKRVASLAAT